MNYVKAIDTLQALSEQHNKKYPPYAYLLVMEGLEWAQRRRKSATSHISGQDFARALFMYSIEKWGPTLAKVVWEELKILASEDLGQMVYHLVESGLMGKQDEDSVDDFNGVCSIKDFDEVEDVFEYDWKNKEWVAFHKFSDKVQHLKFQPD